MSSAAAEPRPVTRPITHRLPQLHAGIRVVGGGESMDLDARGQRLRHFDHRVDGITVSPVPTIAADAVARLAGEPIGEPELVVLPWRPGGILAWRATTPTHPPATILVDAHTGLYIAKTSHARHARGRVYAKHPDGGLPFVVDLLDLAGDGERLVGAYAHVMSVFFNAEGQGVYTRFAEADEAGDFLYEPDERSPVDAFAEVNAYWHVTAIARYFDAVFDVRPPQPTEVIVNYRESPDEGYLNAFAYRDPESGRFHISAGQADELDMAYDGMTLVHEYGHPVFDLLNDINENNTYPITSDAKGFHPAPHAINEGASDYWAASFFDDPDVLSQFDEGISSRNVDNDLRCPSDVWGEAHLDAPVVSGTMWRVREIVGRTDADAIVFDVLGRLSDSPTFDELATRISEATAARVAIGEVTPDDQLAVDAVLAERGLVGCGRELALVDGEPFTSHMPGADTAAGLLGTDADLCDTLRTLGVQIPLAFSYFTRPPDVDASRLEALELELAFVRADGKDVGEIDLQYQVLVRRDAPVTMEVLSIPFGGQEFQLPIRAAEFDHAVPDEPTTVRITTADVPLDPASVYYLNVLALNCPLTTHTVTARWIVTPEVDSEPGPEAAPEAGPEAAAEAEGEIRVEGGGCGCGAGSSSGDPLAVGALAAVAAALARRRFPRV